MKNRLELLHLLALMFVVLLLLGGSMKTDEIRGGYDSMKTLLVLFIVAAAFVGGYLLGNHGTRDTRELQRELESAREERTRVVVENAELRDRVSKAQIQLSISQQDRLTLERELQESQDALKRRTGQKIVPKPEFRLIERPAAKDFETVPRTAPGKTKKQ